MVVHLRKLAVGCDSVEYLAERQKARLENSELEFGKTGLFTFTRNTPRRRSEIEGQGSLYWVIKGQFRVRQLITGLEDHVDEEGRKYCLIHLDPKLHLTEVRGQKAFQGWRYLEDAAKPADLAGEGVEGVDELPHAMAEELRELGLL